MSLPIYYYGAIWEIRTTGSDDNGGAFYPLVAGGTGIDYSQQDAPQLTLTDVAYAAGDNALPFTLTSITGGFTPDMLGNTIGLLTSGNYYGGHYVIISVVDANTIQVAGTAMTIGGACTSGTINVGGCLAHPGVAFGNSYSPLPYVLTTPVVNHGSSGYNDTFYIKSGTYIESPFIINGGPAGGWNIIGYTLTRNDGAPTRPIIEAWSGYGTPSISFIDEQGVQDSFENIIFNANNYQNITLNQENTKNSFTNCDFINGIYSCANLHGGQYVNCNFNNSGSGGIAWSGNPGAFDFVTTGVCINSWGTNFLNCNIFDNQGPGIYVNAGGIGGYNFTGVIIDHNQGPGIFQDSGNGAQYGNIQNCVIDHNGYDGILANLDSSSITTGYILDTFTMTNTIISNNGAYGINSRDVDYSGPNMLYFSEKVSTCAFYNNTSGNLNRVASPVNMITLSADPFIDSSSGDYALNNISGGGELCRNLSYTYFISGYTTTDVYVGAITPNHPTGGGGGLFTNNMNGGMI